MAKDNRGGQRGNSGISTSSNKLLGKKGSPRTVEEALATVNTDNYINAESERMSFVNDLQRKINSGEMSYNEARLILNNQGENPYGVNCQRCVWAYELQRRGYDVEALPNLDSKTDPNRLGANYNWMTLDKNNVGKKSTGLAFLGGNSYGNVTNTQNAKNAVSVMSEWGEGSRGAIFFGRKSGSGHVFNVEYSKGKIIAVDAQTGKKYDSLLRALTSNKADAWSVRIIRTDNANIDLSQVGKYVKKRGA